MCYIFRLARIYPNCFGSDQVLGVQIYNSENNFHFNTMLNKIIKVIPFT